MSTRTRILYAAISLSVLAVLLSSLKNEFVWDDNVFIAQNPHIGQVDRIGVDLTTSFWQGAQQFSEQADYFWRPLTTFVIHISALVFGPSPTAFHGISLIVAALSALLFGLLCASVINGPFRMEIPLFVSLIYLIHPLHVETLAMAMNISDSLAMSFLLGGCLLAFRWFRSSLRSLYMVPGLVLLCLGACFSKEIGASCVGIPVVTAILLHQVDPAASARSLKSPVLWICPFIAVAIYGALRWRVLSGVHGPLNSPLFSPLTIPLAWGEALFQAVVPVAGSAHVYIAPSSVGSWIKAVCLLTVLAAVVATQVFRRRWYRLPAWGLLGGLLLLLPSLFMVPQIEGFIRLPVRYLHVVMPGFLLAVIPLLAQRWSRLYRLAAVLLIVACSLLSFVRISSWRTNNTSVLAEFDAHPEQAVEVLDVAKIALAANDYDKARTFLQQASTAVDIQYPPHRALRYSLQARIAAFQEGDPDRATRLIRQAISLHATHLLYVLQLAAFRSMAGHPGQSIQVLRKALQAPWFSEFQKNRIRVELARYTADKGARSADSPDGVP